METPRILVVDDEEHIRLTVSQSLSTLPAEVETAADGQQALEKVQRQEFSAILLDLRMPGMDGMEVLRRLRDDHPEVPVVIITAHGNVESAVEAMKLGAIEFQQKPFRPDEIRAVVSKVLERQRLSESGEADYRTYFELAKKSVSERRLEAAMDHLKKAIGIDPERPEAFNLLGTIHELRGERLEAVKNYRVACHIDGRYEPSHKNLARITGTNPSRENIVFGDLRGEAKE